MSLQEYAEDEYCTSGSGWDHIGSESIVEESDTLDDVQERIDLDEEPFEFDNNGQPEPRAANVVEAFNTVFPTDSALGLRSPSTTDYFPNHNLYNSNTAQQQSWASYFPELEQSTPDTNGDTNGAAIVYTPYNNSTETVASTWNRTRYEPGAQHHEPQGRISSTARSILLAFFNTCHYPTSSNRESLAQLTGLTPSQVDTWFKNRRHRKVTPSTSSFSTIPIQASFSTGQYQVDQQYAQHSGRSGSTFAPTNTEALSILSYLPVPHKTGGDHGMQNPSLQAYRNTPPRDDAPPVTVSESVIGFRTNRRASEMLTEVETPVGRDTGASGPWIKTSPEVDLHSSFDMSRESTQMSPSPSLAIMALSSKPGRQGKRKDVQVFPRENIDAKKRFQCTECFKPFAIPSDMRRHMETQHYPQNEWICMREGARGLRVLNHLSEQICILCHSPDPGDDHFYDSHKVLQCLQRNPSHSFNRKDQLSGHIKRCHNKERCKLPGLDDVLSQWKAPVYTSATQPIRYCGFCQSQVRGQEFINHITKHYSEGYDMARWIEPQAHHN